MILDLNAEVKVAYKKLKQMVYYDKHPLQLRRRLAEFECLGDFEKRLDAVAKVAATITPHDTPKFQSWLSEIRFDVIPKGVDIPMKLADEQGSYVSNVSSSTEHPIAKVNYLFDGPIELHLLAVLWLMIDGPDYDLELTKHCYGSRLHQFVGNGDDHSAFLFKKYHELYAKWRDSGIQKARDLLSEDQQSVCVIGLDVQEYYYRIQLDWEELRTQINRPVPKVPRPSILMKRQILGDKLFKCIREVCTNYREKLDPMLAVTHSDLSDAAACLPIGFCASPVIANWYLKAFDDAILENVRPAYYGRYVDDILMVVTMSKPPDETDPISSFMDGVLVRAGILKFDKKNARFELISRPGLFLQKKKCILQYFDSEHSTAGLDKFQKKIEENASDFALLPVDGDESPVEQVAYDLLYDGSVNKFRSVKAVVENRWELASHLAKRTQLYLMTEGPVDTDLRDELMRFFKGRNAIDYWDMWERVISFLEVAGDRRGVSRFCKAMQSEIEKVVDANSNSSNKAPRTGTIVTSQMTLLLRASLKRHLEISIELGRAIICSSDATRIWRESNLIRHHIVAIPLLNYTGFEGNLAAPNDAVGLSVDDSKASKSPRFVRFDECLGFVDSSCASHSKKNSVARANEIFKKFHGDVHPDVTYELTNEDESK